MVQATEPQTKLVKPRTKAGKRVLEKRAPKLVRCGRWTLPMRLPCSRGPCSDNACSAASRRRRCQPANGPPAATHPMQVEDPKRALLVYGNKTSQVVKDVMTDLHKLKGVRCRCLLLSAWAQCASLAFLPAAAWPLPD